MDMIEKIARAMCNAAWADVDEDWSLAGDEQKAEFRLMAAAAIKAMIDAELPPHVVKAGGALSMVKGHQVLANLNAMAIYRAMLTAAMEASHGER